MDFNVEDLGLCLGHYSSLIASAFGAVCSAYFTMVNTWRERLVCIFLGVVVSVYLSEPIYATLPILGEKATCFLTGFFGLNICAAFLKSIRRFGDDADFWTLLRELVIRLMDRYLPPKEPKEKPAGEE